MKNKRKTFFIVVLVLLILINIGLVSYYFSNRYQSRIGNAHISPGGESVAFEQTLIGKKKQVLFQLILQNLKSKEAEVMFSKILSPNDQPLNLQGFGADDSQLVLNRGNLLSIFENKGVGFEVIRLAFSDKKAKPGEKNNETSSDLLGTKGVRMGFKVVNINKPDRLINLPAKTEIQGKDLPDRLSFGNMTVINFENKAYYLIIAEKTPKGFNIKKSSLEPVPLNEEESKKFYSNLPEKIAVYLYNPEKKSLYVLVECEDSLDKFIENMSILPQKSRILFIQNQKVSLYKLESPELEKEFPLEEKIDGRKLFRPFKQQIVSATATEEEIFIASGKNIIRYEIDKGKEEAVTKPGQGIIHSVDSDAAGKKLVVESFSDGRNHICILEVSNGKLNKIVSDSNIFIFPAAFKEQKK